MNTTSVNGQEVEISEVAARFLSEDMGAGSKVEDYKNCDVEEMVEGCKKALNNEASEETIENWRMALTEIINLANKSEEQIIADAIRSSQDWDKDLLEKLCDLAGMSKEWKAADGETFEAVAFAAAEKLGVKII
jgi:hypothetical protein